MLRTYKSLDNHVIFIYQVHVEHLICEVWCNATDEHTCQELLSEEFEIIYLARDWVKLQVDDIYETCRLLSDDERAAIREAFFINNDIESLCEGFSNPIELGTLHNVVSQKIKPLLIRFYNELISAKDKLNYFNALLKKNKNLDFCPCCGLIRFENYESPFREDNDHYLPKAEYPFAAVNFFNLPPLCSKCNKKWKTIKNPFENGRTSFNPFRPLESEFEIQIEIKNTDLTNFLNLADNEVEISFNNDVNKVDTWNWLFGIKTRYRQEIIQFSKTELRTLINRIRRNEERKQGMSYEEILQDVIEDYNIDRYDDRKFLKASFLMEMLNKPEWLAIYR